MALQNRRGSPPAQEFEISLRLMARDFRRVRSIPDAAPDAKELENALCLLASNIDSAKRRGRWVRSFVNVFDVLGRVRLEAAHSSVLAWLLDPVESHGLGVEFLQRILAIVNKRESLNTTGAVVTVERTFSLGRFDIFVRGRDWVLVIENKIDHMESADQTDTYASELRAYELRGIRAFGLFLTPDGRRPDNPRFTSVSYGTIRRLLCELHPNKSAAILVTQFERHLAYDIEKQHYGKD